MAGVTPEFAAAAAARPVGELEPAWSTDPRTLQRARTVEVSGWTFYVAGRAGVLGDDVDPDTVAAAIGTIAAEALHAGWQDARRVGPSAVASARLDECARWGDERLDGVADARLVDLLERVVGGADATALPIFAATRTMAASVAAAADKPGARAALLVHVLSELHTGALLIACRAVGLRPVEALIAGPEGEQEAVTLGWSRPFPSRLAVLRRYTYACALADRISGAAYVALDAAQRSELVDRLTEASAAVAEG
jgi:hypothetical protein